jgi:hypothetical protein
MPIGGGGAGGNGNYFPSYCYNSAKGILIYSIY